MKDISNSTSHFGEASNVLAASDLTNPEFDDNMAENNIRYDNSLKRTSNEGGNSENSFNERNQGMQGMTENNYNRNRNRNNQSNNNGSSTYYENHNNDRQYNNVNPKDRSMMNPEGGKIRSHFNPEARGANVAFNQTENRPYVNTRERARYKPPMLRGNNMNNNNMSNNGNPNMDHMNPHNNISNPMENGDTVMYRNYNNNARYNPGYNTGYNNNGNNYNRNPNFNRSRFIPQTAWANRDNRRYFFENEEEIFPPTKDREEGNFDIYNAVPVEISGYGTEHIKAIENFDDPELKLHNQLLLNITKVKYTQTTPIQRYSLSAVMNKNDLIAVAQTGSGKTAGYLIPIINHMLASGPPQHTFYESANTGDGSAHTNYYIKKIGLPVCLILAPTRELAIQIYSDARKFAYRTGIKSVVLYGGSSIKNQMFSLEKGVDIVVATPGRLNDILEKQRLKLFLTSFLVLDEADRMLDMGFSAQIRSILNDYDMPGNDNDLRNLQRGGVPRKNFNGPNQMNGRNGNKLEYQKYCTHEIKRQTIMFSATFKKEIQVLAKEYLCKYTYLLVGKVGSTHEYIKQNLVYVTEEEKGEYLVNLLNEQSNGLTLVFVETKRKANMIERFLNNKRLNAIGIHGDKSQDERERALKLFRRGDKPILVATDVAARGLDVSNIKHVVNFDIPSNIDDYVHRIGRTGRAGNIGIATTFVNDDNRTIFRELLSLMEECNQTIPPWFFNLVMKHTASAKGNRSGNNRYNNNYNRNRNNYGGGGGGFQSSEYSNNRSGGGFQSNNMNSMMSNTGGVFNRNVGYNNRGGGNFKGYRGEPGPGMVEHQPNDAKQQWW